MDTTQKPHLSHISLCFGYGGIDLGLHRIFGDRLRLAAVCEIEAFALENALSKMEAGLLPPAPIWNDLRTFPWEEFQDVTLVSGGFPCQPFSAAGKREGDQDPRHLFPFIVDGIKRCRPRFVFLENVEGILSSKLAGEGWADTAGTPVLLHVFRELERVGYKAEAGIFSASETGAPHQRKRIFILAHREEQGLEGLRRLESNFIWNDASSYGTTRGTELGNANNYSDTEAGYAEAHRLQSEHWKDVCSGFAGGADATSWPSRPGEQQYAWEPPRTTGRVATNPGLGKQIPSQQHWASEINCERSVGNYDADNKGYGLSECEPASQRKAEENHGSHFGCDAFLGAKTNGNGHQPQRWEQVEQRSPQFRVCNRGREQRSRATDGFELHKRGEKPNEQTDIGASGADKDIRRGTEVNCQNLWSMPADDFADSFWKEVERTEAVGNASQREDYGREPRDLGQAAGEGRCGNDAADGAGESMGNASQLFSDGSDNNSRISERSKEISKFGNSSWKTNDNECSKTECEVGRNAYEPSIGVDISELSGLSHSELAEIREWMVKTDNRTDELRLLGNGVVPATATRAFLTLLEKLK